MSKSGQQADILCLMQEFQNMGCDNQAKCAVAAKVYLDLMQKDGQITDLEKHYDHNLAFFYFRGQRAGMSVIFWPTLRSQSIDLMFVRRIRKQLMHEDEQNLTLAICDSSSTISYYKMHDEVL